MGKVYGDFESLIGNTPVMELKRYKNKYKLGGNIFAKLEFFNPAGSIKDRTALSMINDAEERGVLQKGSTIIEPTSGNTGIALAALGKARGYKVILTMPETMSRERRNLLRVYGADLVLTDGREGMKGAIAKAEELASVIDNAFIPSQFANKANPKIHFETTGPEIWNDMYGKVDIFVATAGTGGTLSGTGEYLKKMNNNILIYAVEPSASAVLSGENPGFHKIQGIGAGFIPETLNTEIYDGIIKISDEEAFEAGADFPHIEGILIGISSGAALAAAVKLADLPENKDKNIVVIFPDGGDRYLSTEMYNR